MLGDIFQPTHLLFLLVVVLLVLGPKRLPEMARSLGRGMRDFRDAVSGVNPMNELHEHQQAMTSPTPAAPEAPVSPSPAEAVHTESSAGSPVPPAAPDPAASSQAAPSPSPQPVESGVAATSDGHGETTVSHAEMDPVEAVVVPAPEDSPK